MKKEESKTPDLDAIEKIVFQHYTTGDQTIEKFMKQIKVVLACTDSQGSPSLILTSVKISENQYQIGDHYELAKSKALNFGFQPPFVLFDEQEFPKAIKMMVEQNMIYRP